MFTRGYDSWEDPPTHHPSKMLRRGTFQGGEGGAGATVGS